MTTPEIIYQDDNVLVLDKPAGWIVNDAQTVKDQPVVQIWLKNTFDYSLAGNRELRSGIVHRLDKETSGILLIAKNKTAFENLQMQFKDRKVEKKYTALVHGRVKLKVGEITATVGRLPWRRDRFGIMAGGRESLTKYEVISGYSLLPAQRQHLRDYTLVEFFPKTGRTHQIRIHAKYIGHPVVADEFYAGRKTAREDRKWCPRLFLHASEIKFLDPVSAKPKVFKSRLPQDLKVALNYLLPVKTS